MPSGRTNLERESDIPLMVAEKKIVRGTESGIRHSLLARHGLESTRDLLALRPQIFRNQSANLVVNIECEIIAKRCVVATAF